MSDDQQLNIARSYCAAQHLYTWEALTCPHIPSCLLYGDNKVADRATIYTCCASCAAEDPLWWSEAEVALLTGTRLEIAVAEHRKILQKLRFWRDRLVELEGYCTVLCTAAACAATGLTSRPRMKAASDVDL